MRNEIAFGEDIDKTITIDIPGRGVIHDLYKAARNDTTSLTMAAAKAIIDKISQRDNIAITTGFLIPPTMKPETDGPIGALILSKTLHSLFQVKTHFIAEREVLNLLEKLSKLKCLMLSDSIDVLPFTLNEKEATKDSLKLIDEINPSTIIAIEKVGRNNKGIYHNMRGLDVSNKSIKIDYLFREAKKADITTIGIGDGGNEIGMGNIYETIKRIVSFGSVCNCPCGSGIATNTKTDFLITSAVSNWGAYGLSACISYLTDNSFKAHNDEIERRLLLEAAKIGAVDGVTGLNTHTVDGINVNIHSCIVNILKTLVMNALKRS
jgi:hypothetical protein